MDRSSPEPGQVGSGRVSGVVSEVSGAVEPQSWVGSTPRAEKGKGTRGRIQPTVKANTDGLREFYTDSDPSTEPIRLHHRNPSSEDRLHKIAARLSQLGCRYVHPPSLPSQHRWLHRLDDR